jgi:hypothetical protein
VAPSKSRKRRKRRPPPKPATDDAAVVEPPVPERPPGRRGERAAPDERPPAPWGSFPLIELCVLAGIIFLVLGFFVVGGERGTVLIFAGLALGSIGGLDLSIREHFAGYRSHTLVLAGVPAVVVLGVLFYLGPGGLPAVAKAAIGACVFGLSAYALTRAFSNRSGGFRYKLPERRRRS